MFDLIKRYWRTINRPSAYFSLGFLTLGGFVAGVVFWGAFNTAMEVTNTEAFCTGCHEMHDNVYQELQSTIHYTNRSGVRAICSNCHVPHAWTNKIARKMQHPRKCKARFSARSTRARNSRHTGLSWPSTNGIDSRPTIHWNAVTVTTTTRWTSRGKARARRPCTPNIWAAKRKPVSTATRVLRTICPTCRR